MIDLLLLLLVLLPLHLLAREARFPRNVMPIECNDGQLPRDADVQRCLRVLHGDVALPFDCSHLSELVYNSGEPFASGLWKEAFRASWRGRDVVVKRNLKRNSSGRRNVVFEAIRMTLLRAPSHVELLGHCSQADDTAINLVAFVGEWGAAVNGGSLSSIDRIDIALRIVDMLVWWRDSPFGPLVHCDLLPAQIGIGDGNLPLLLDLDDLVQAPYSNGHLWCPNAHSDACGLHCFKGKLLGDAAEHLALPLEAACPANNQCRTFGSEYNVWAVCHVLFTQLLTGKLATRHDLLRRCTDDEPSRRPTPEQLADELRALRNAQQRKN